MDIFPFENAVNMDDAKILKPAIKKLVENNPNPSIDISLTFVPAGENNDIIADEKTIEIRKITIEIIPINIRHILKIRFNCNWFLLP